MHRAIKELPTVAEELGKARLGDARLTRRLALMADRAMSAPDAGFPQMVASDAELEGVYRFLSNEAVTAEAILRPHVDATLERARAQGTVLAIHDTTSFEFGGVSPRDGLGLMVGSGQGFFAHVALAVAPGEARLALGVLGLEHWRRTQRKKSNHKKNTRDDPQRESLRWGRMLAQVESSASSAAFQCIHVMDREADIIDLLLDARRLGARYVIRAAHDRAVFDCDEHVRERIATLEPKLRLTIALSARHDRGRPGVVRKRHPKRAARLATIEIAACTVDLRPGPYHPGEPPLRVNVVHVREVNPPRGEAPVDWLVYTTEAIETEEQLVAVVDVYRARWVIEEYFKALKTGCALEKRQLESYRALTNALAMFMPIAWRLLVARSISRIAPKAPARTIVTPVQLRLLVHKLELQRAPRSAEDAVYAVARLGGHLRRNGPPGWQTLGRGFEALLLMQAGWRAAVEAGICDQ
jgi:hypothetical protein